MDLTTVEEVERNDLKAGVLSVRSCSLRISVPLSHYYSLKLISVISVN